MMSVSVTGRPEKGEIGIWQAFDLYREKKHMTSSSDRQINAHFWAIRMADATIMSEF